nr:hypothetical protein [Salinispora pacifica]
MIDSEAVIIGAEAARRLAEQRRVELEPGLTAAEFDVSRGGSGSSSLMITGRSSRPACR